MSDRRRPNSRKCATKESTLLNEQKPQPNSRRVKDTPSTRPTNASKRTRLDSVFSKSVGTKKRKEIVYDGDDDDDIKEIFPDNKEPLGKSEIDRCAICLDDCTEPKELAKCGHIFCTACIDQYFETVKPQCPCCFTIYGEIRGNQPVNGTMTIDNSKHRLPGFEHDSCGSIRITYSFPNGIQDETHPNPGTPYYGTTRQAFLPDNSEGRYVLKLLKKAFELRQIFTVGQSRTTGYDNVITWNDIHHKTSIQGGAENFGYPDSTYLNRVKQELAAKGIK
ncbi:unnamed protein product [Adineta ricciae]|uniref:E3 ubiquitin-protein ligase n=1 Tax=Adineta ricciae TaxID=249248 RepID=A0A813W6M0_ADIRI|nr:unnamed protein product [Adineta ricciae]